MSTCINNLEHEYPIFFALSLIFFFFFFFVFFFFFFFLYVL